MCDEYTQPWRIKLCTGRCHGREKQVDSIVSPCFRKGGNVPDNNVGPTAIIEQFPSRLSLLNCFVLILEMGFPLGNLVYIES